MWKRLIIHSIAPTLLDRETLTLHKIFCRVEYLLEKFSFCLAFLYVSFTISTNVETRILLHKRNSPQLTNSDRVRLRFTDFM